MRCRARLGSVCAQCGRANLPEAAYCISCGKVDVLLTGDATAASELLALGKGAFVVAYRWRKIDLDPSARRLALTYRASAQDYLGVFSINRRFNTLFSVPSFAMVGGWVSSNLLIGNAAISAEDLSTPPPEPFVGYLPVLFDLDARLVRPIPHPFLDVFPGNRHHVQAVLHGPFARVVNTGSCLSVRAQYLER